MVALNVSACGNGSRLTAAWQTGLVTCCVLTLSGCASGTRPERPLAAAAEPTTALTHADVLWLERVTFGLSEPLLADYRRLGRAGFLDQQLAARDERLPPGIAAQIDSLDVARVDSERLLADLASKRRALEALAPDARVAGRMALNQLGNELARQAVERELLRAIYARSQLREQMVWFWLNHFSVFQGKGELRFLAGDYAERAIRPHALGRFRDLVLATLEHPAMLRYLDNQQNRAGHVNENYARELLELHTLGVGGGYSQQDVQQLALILTGAGVNPGPPPRLPRPLQSAYLRRGAFEFNPAHHDPSDKRLLGHRIRGADFDEIERAVTLIVRQSTCAHFISRQLAVYFVADEPPETLVNKMARTFERSDGDIAAVLRTLFLAPEFDAALGGKFKDPMRYVVSAIRLVYGDREIRDPAPLINWLRTLGELPFGRLTPDGYPLTESGWASPGQLAVRFEVAHAIVSAGARLLVEADASQPPRAPSAPTAPIAPPATIASELYSDSLAPYLAANTQSVLARARSPQEWSALLLSSPEFNYE